MEQRKLKPLKIKTTKQNNMQQKQQYIERQ